MRSRPATGRSTTCSSRRPTGDRTAAGGRRRGLRPRLPALFRPPRRPPGGHAGAVAPFGAPGAGPAPAVAPEGVPVDAAGPRHHPRHHQRRCRLGHPQQPGGDGGLRVHHLPGLRGRVDAADPVRGPHRPRRGVPGSGPAGAAAAVLPAPDRGRLRGGQGGGHLLHRLRVLVPVPGGAVRRPDAGEEDGALTYFTDHAEVLWQVPIAVALLALLYSAVGVALASLTDRRIVGGVAIIGLAFVTSAVAGIVVDASQGEGTPLAVIGIFFVPLDLRDLVFLGHLHPVDSGLSGVEGGGLIAIVAFSVYVIAAFSLLLYRYREVDL